jgi:hypothetical protein
MSTDRVFSLFTRTVRLITCIVLFVSHVQRACANAGTVLSPAPADVKIRILGTLQSFGMCFRDQDYVLSPHRKIDVYVVQHLQVANRFLEVIPEWLASYVALDSAALSQPHGQHLEMVMLEPSIV